MKINKSSARPARPAMRRPMGRPITASSSVTAGIRSRQATAMSKPSISLTGMDPARKAFTQQILANCRRMSGKSTIMGATNTTNIIVKPDFLEFLPMFVQKLLILDVFGSVAMNSRQQLVPYFKFIAENTKGQTHAGDILSSPMVNRQGIDPNFTGRLVKEETVTAATASTTFTTGTLAYKPVLPGSVTIYTTISGTVTPYTDDGAGTLLTSGGASAGTITYSTGAFTFSSSKSLGAGDTVTATYQYDNETVGPDANGNYGASMGKGYLQLDEFNLVAEAHQLACYWSIYSAFAAQQEYGANLGDMSKEAAFSELTAEINSAGFDALKATAALNTQYNWDASPVVQGSVVPSDYLNMFKLKLNQAAAGVYQATNLARPNRLIVGTNVASYISMIDSFQADTVEDTVGPYKLGKLDQFDVFVAPYYDPNEWVMACKSNDIRRNSALFGEYMPLTETQPIGLANASVQQGYATMYAMKVVNPATTVRGVIVGSY